MRFRIRLMTVLLSIAMAAVVSAQAGLPALIIDGSGVFTVVSKSGQLIDANAGTSLRQGSKLTLEAGARVTVLLNDQFTVYDTPGEFTLKDVNEDDDLFDLNFDPIFAEYVKASMMAVDRHIEAGLWPVNMTTADGDGWGKSGGGGVKGWGKGSTGGVKGWGKDSPLGDKGWGKDNPISDKGWGKDSPISDKGWGKGSTGGVKGRSGLFGFGKEKKSTAQGWGLVNRYSPSSGWGAMYRSVSKGWGVQSSQSDKGWGKSDPVSAKGWGKDSPLSDKGWGKSGGGGVKGWSQDDMTIQLAQPGGYYAPADMHLAWSPVKRTSRYLVVVYDLSNTVLFTESTSEPSMVVPFGNLPQEKSLYYQVYAEGRNAISPPTFFKVMDAEDYTDSQSTYTNSSIYASSSNYIQDLMRAISYEHDERLLDCSRLYASMMETYPSNRLVQFCYAGFLHRMGLDASVELVF